MPVSKKLVSAETSLKVSAKNFSFYSEKLNFLYFSNFYDFLNITYSVLLIKYQ